jgi:hypothetical protein
MRLDGIVCQGQDQALCLDMSEHICDIQQTT